MPLNRTPPRESKDDPVCEDPPKFIPPTGKLSIVTRKGNEIRELLDTRSSEKSKIEQIFADYKIKVETLTQSVSMQLLEGEEDDKRNEWWNLKNEWWNLIVNLSIIVQKYLDEITTAERQVRAPSVRTHKTNSSCHSSTSSAARVRLAEKKAQLNSEKNYHEKMKRLEKEELRRKTEEIEHKEKLRAVNLERMELEQKLFEKELNDMDRQFDDYTSQIGKNEECNVVDDGRTGNQRTESNVVIPKERTLIEVMQKQADISNKIMKHQEKAELPRKEIFVFDGKDVTKYNIFMRNFKRIIEDKCDQPADCLYYLEQYTSGTARELVRSCGHSDVSIAYAEALRLLSEEYGNSHKTATAYLDKIDKWPQIKGEDGEALRELSIFLLECSNNLDSHTVYSQLNHPKEIMSIVMKLPYDMRKKWRSKALDLSESRLSVTFHDLVTFVRNQSKLVNQPLFGSIKDAATRENSRPVNKTSLATNVLNSADCNPSVVESPQVGNNRYCIYCGKNNHDLSYCFFFKKLNYAHRLEFIENKGLCYGCLRGGHTSRGCTRRQTCDICRRKHPTLLHEREEPRRHSFGEIETGVTEREEAALRTAEFHTDSVKRKVVCAVLPVKIRIPGRKDCITTYASLDTCSTSCFMDEKLLNELGIAGQPVNLKISTMQGDNSRKVARVVNNLEILDMHNEICEILPVVYAQDQWPFKPDDSPKREELSSELVDSISYQFVSANIGLLIGMNHPGILKPIKVVGGPSDGPYATLHSLGWAICGPAVKPGNVIANRVCIREREAIESLISEMYDHDYKDSHVIYKAMSENDKKFEAVMVDTMRKLSDGHYEVDLPLKPVKLPNNRSQVYNSFKALSRKLQADCSLFDQYREFVEMMITRGFAELVSAENIKSKAWYLSHHAVFHKQKKKIRVVFNCSLKHSGISLNDILYQGPDLTSNLLGVLLRFRQERVAFMGDIEKMFYQIRVTPTCRDYLRFFWFPNSDRSAEPVEYRLTVHVFGATSSPSVANYVLRQTAVDNLDSSPEAKTAIFRNFYVDDLLYSTDSDDRARDLLNEVSDIVKTGGFVLTKIVSNSKSLTSVVPNEESLVVGELPDRNQSCALGMFWNVEHDQLKFKINFRENPNTRRGVLSTINSVYDPFGLCSPAVLIGKLLFQETCKLKLDWDEQLTGDIAARWKILQEKLYLLESYKVDRCFKPGFIVNRIELHFFCDGSEVAYGAIAYLRFVGYDEDDVHCVPVLAKTRLTPLNSQTHQTIPKTELNGAKLSILLSQILSNELSYVINKIFYWTDSYTVLKYINSEDGRFARFVSNRVSFIRSHSMKTQWRYVPSKLNPADHASRGVTVPSFLELDSWKYGPKFLWQAESFWPSTEQMTSDEPKESEIGIKYVLTTKIDEDNNATDVLLNSCSDWNKLKRKIAWILRLKKILLSGIKIKSSLTMKEIKDSENCIVKYTQEKHFPGTIQCLTEQKYIHQKDPLKKLSPFIDGKGMLRVGGRLQASSLQDSAKHPLILPKKAYISELIVKNTHRCLGHMGRETIVGFLRQNFWIIGLNSLIRSTLYNCVICRKYSAQPCEQIMANLPDDRLEADIPAFTQIGCDFFGHFDVVNGRRREKRYGVVFSCLSSRAIHIEMAYSLNTDSFINALRRFQARRGNVKLIRCDNGTNLRSGSRELRQSIENWNHTRIQGWMLQNNIEWKFNPPTGSHFGGVYEREIRSVRKVLNSLMSEQVIKLSDENLNTLFCEVEAILNCRPLTELSQDCDDLEALTPNHLLLLHAGVTFPPGVFSRDDTYTTKRWKQVQYLVDLFWNRWKREYLPLLQQRSKWFRPGYQFKFGDLVLLTDQQLPRNQWSLGRVVKTYPNDKGEVRVVRVKVAKYKDAKKNTVRSGIIELDRPVNKIVLISSY